MPRILDQRVTVQRFASTCGRRIGTLPASLHAAEALPAWHEPGLEGSTGCPGRYVTSFRSSRTYSRKCPLTIAGHQPKQPGWRCP